MFYSYVRKTNIIVESSEFTTPYRIGQERKNFTVNPSVAGHKYYISWLVAIGIKSFHRGLF